MPGSVVVSAAQDYVRSVSVAIGDIQAEYNLNSGVADPSDSSSCAPLLSLPSGCSGPTGSSTEMFEIGFWECLMPSITSISPQNVTSGQNVVISGSGFSTTACQNEVDYYTLMLKVLLLDEENEISIHFLFERSWLRWE